WNTRRPAVTGLFPVQAPPYFFAVILVESDHSGVLASDQSEQPITVEQQLTGKTPQRSFGVEILFEISFPKHLAGIHLETEQIAFTAECEVLIAAHRRIC